MRAKKLLGLLLIFALIFSVAPKAFADSSVKLNVNLTCNGSNAVNKETGDVITVTVTLENATNANAAFGVSSLASEIYYDHEFFEYVDGSLTVTDDLGILDAELRVEMTTGEHRILMHGFTASEKQYAPKQVVGSFQLKVIAASGRSTVESKSAEIMSTNGEYVTTIKNLVVTIGETPAVECRSIVSIEKTKTVGLVDTYTITYTDGTTSTFTVTNGEDGSQGIQGEKGEDGYTPVITIQDGYWYVDGVNTNQLAQGVQGDKGDKGDPGADGLTPYIGENGHWWIGETDTGVPARGQDGNDGEDGKDGTNGKDGVDGENGKDGVDGKTPYIGTNGNWWIGETDTGVKAEGSNGEDGKDGVGIQKAEINDKGELVITLTDGTVINAGSVVPATVEDSCDLTWVYILLVVTIILSNAGWVVLLVLKRKREGADK